MKLIVQIPCFNEEATLRQTVADIPRTIEGVDAVEILIIDDGSSDSTIPLALQVGVDHIVQHKNNKGLARAFRSGVEAALALGADIIVNTDGDNQYAGGDIPKLVRPILDGKADIVVGDRQTDAIAHFSPLKKRLQNLGSGVVRLLSGTEVPDTVSGFRALSREAAMQINIVSPFSYTIEMLIQAGRKNMAIATVPIDTNAPTRDSRLFKSVPNFVQRSLSTMLRMYSMYQPLRTFMLIGGALSFVGMIPIARFLYFYLVDSGQGHVQSLVLGGVLLMIGLTTFLIGLVADLIGFNRQLIEMTLEKVRYLEFDLAQREVPGHKGPKSPSEPFDAEEMRAQLGISGRSKV
jgi:glycosyltransferase involved in cell wall biosynthesis